MKILGFKIGKNSESSKIHDSVSLKKQEAVEKISVSSPELSTKPISSIAPIKPGVLKYSQSFSRGRGYFIGAEYDLSEIGKIEDVDCFVRQAFKKKLGLMFKEGLGYSGANKNTLKYIKIRLAQLARASNIPTISLLKRLSHSLIRTSNAFLIKVRNEKSSGGKTRKDSSGKTLKPIAAYFPAAPETMRADIDPDTGEIRTWRQILPDRRYREFSPDDVIHFTRDQREGFLFGIPEIIPVIDDIRALRQIEENIELLLYQHLFPLFHYKVGTESAPASYSEDGFKEVDMVRAEIEMMPSEGAIVTPERHEIKAIGSEGRALRAEGYLEHFKKRVFAGLGVSQVDMGDGNTSNRATAQTLSRQLVDSVKDIQDSLEAQWDHLVFSELLLESNFAFDVLAEENLVHLVFNEIDIKNKMEQEQHSLELFKGNAITWDELRSQLHKEPILVPDDVENQDPASWPEWFNTYWKLFGEPENLIRAVDEPYSVSAKAAAESRSLGISRAQVSKSSEEKKEEKEEKISSPSSKTKDSHSLQSSYLKENYTELQSSIIPKIIEDLTRTGQVQSYTLSLVKTWKDSVVKQLSSLGMASLIKGFNELNISSDRSYIEISNARQEILERYSFLVDKFVSSLMQKITKTSDLVLFGKQGIGLSKTINDHLFSIFDSLEYRLRFFDDIESKKAYNYGKIIGFRLSNIQSFGFEVAKDACEQCQRIRDQIIPTYSISLQNSPPYHLHSKLKIKPIL